MEMSHLGGMREFTYLLLADAQANKQQGNFQDAMDTCLATLRMAGHVGKDTFISYLVGVAISALTYDTIGDVLSAMPPDAAFLADLERELKLPEYNVLEFKTPLLNEGRYLADEILRMSDKKKELPLLLNADPTFLQASADYYRDFFGQYLKILDLPYDEALSALDELGEKPQNDFNAGKKEAFATMILAPATTKVYSISIRYRTNQNALFTSLDLYQEYAKNGMLPKELPIDSAMDLFSGKPFAYEVTEDGFLLRCNEKEQGKDKIWEYEFRIAQ